MGKDKYMREIKFRAWDKKNNIMLQGIELTKLLGYLIFQNCPNSEAYDLLKDHFNDIEWLQFAGLKDKNGKDIYEGDIIIEKGSHYYLGERISVIEFSESQTPFVKGSSGWSEFLHNFDLSNAEIIGNIYENPELIK